MNISNILKRAAEPRKSEPSLFGEKSTDINLVGNMHKYLLSLNDKPRDREPGFHASEVYDICDREYILERLTNIKTKKYVSSDLRTKFILGSNIHTMVQTDILGPAGLLMGYWKCMKCSNLDRSKLTTHPNKKCEKEGCNSSNYEYIEPKMRIEVPNVENTPEWSIVGATDGIVNSNSILDIKTVTASAIPDLEKNWKDIDKLADYSNPDTSLHWSKFSIIKYYVQIQMYMYGFRDKIDSTNNPGYILYIPKDSLEEINRWVTISVQYNPRVIEQIFAKVQRIHDEVKKIGKDEQILLLKRVCGTPTGIRARDCALAKQCFGKHDTW